MDRTEQLEEQVRRLAVTVDEMRSRLSRWEGDHTEPQASARTRRGFLRLGGAAAASALGWLALKTVPAAAATGGNMILGCANAAANPTTVQASAAVTPTFAAEDNGFVAGDLSTALATFSETFNAPLQGLGGSGAVEGIDAWAKGASAYAIYGFTDAGVGVVGESLSGIGLYARTTGRIRQDPQGSSGLPGFSPNLMEQVRDASGVLWIHNASGTWRRVNTVRTDAADGSGSPFKPFRLIDTRGGAIKAAGSTNVVAVAGHGSGTSTVPSDAIAVVGNLTAVNYTGPGFLTIMPAGISYNPLSDPSTVNFIVGQAAIANSFVCGLSGGSLQVYVGDKSSHFIIDITAYIQ